ncbi:MAG: DNA topoisomerase IV subunit A [Bacilli bacterium]|nr:DNA topoisomerase IV subunit A [Bacilli bacterium]
MSKDIYDYSLEEIIGDRFGKYSKYIIQDRALPDVRDGLKPVQRRILYSMFVDGNTFNNPFRKSAKTVGYVIANYHPHGDSSVYEAMVRMSQWWKQSTPLIEMHGNNGSLDNDPPAAMRYTEARLSKISSELLKDIDKNTVNFALNFDDTTEEPTVLPAKFPNILINGAKGIASGYATNIPPHNFNEVVDATIYRIKHPNCNLEDLMKIISGPDFPTGGIVCNKDGIKSAFETGSGQVQIVSKTEILKEKNSIILVITEIPFEVVKSDLVASIDKIRIDKEVDGIIEVRDESDRTGLRIVVEMKKEADYENIINYLMKKTKLSLKYTYNIVAICNKKPLQLGLIDILDYYISHQIDVILRRSNFDLEKSKSRIHIVDGLILAKNNLNEIVEIIRSSKDKSSAKINLINRFKLSEKQAEAIVMLHLYRLTSTEIITLESEKSQLLTSIEGLEEIIENPNVLKRTIVDELSSLSKIYKIKRLSQINGEFIDFSFENKPIIKEEVYISLSRDGYFKRSSIKSFSASDGTLPGYKNGDLILGITQANTADILLVFTDKGNFLYIPVFELMDTKWKEEGKHISHLVSLNGEEKIINAFLVKNFKDGIFIDICSKNGQIKRSKLKDFSVSRYSKAMSCIKLKDNDSVVGVCYSDGDSDFILISKFGKITCYHESCVSVIGYKAAGVKAMKIDSKDEISAFFSITKSLKDNLIVFSNKGDYKVFNPSLLVKSSSRLLKAQELFKYYKSNPQSIISINRGEASNIYYALSTIKDLIEIKMESFKASPIGKSLKNIYKCESNEDIVAVSDLYVPVIDENTPTFEFKEKEIKDENITPNNNNEQKEEKLEKTKKEPTIFDFIDDL